MNYYCQLLPKIHMAFILGNMKEFTKEERLLFVEIVRDIKNHPDKYHEAGQWLDEYCADDKFRQRVEEKWHICKTTENDFTNERRKFCESALKAGLFYDNERDLLRFIIRNTAFKYRMLSDKINIAHFKTFLLLDKISKCKIELKDLFYDAIDYCLKNYENTPIIENEIAGRILLITWLLTDPNKKTYNLKITKFEKLTKMEQTLLLSDTIAPGKRRNEKWMQILELALETVKTEEETKKSLTTVDEYMSKTVEIDLKDFSKCKSKTLLEELIEYPSGVNYNVERHGKVQPKTLKERLKAKQCDEAAKYIHKNKNTISIDPKIKIKAKK